MSKLKEKLMLSEKGYSDLKKAITACTITNIALLLPSMVACLLFWELLKPFTGETISWVALWKLLGLGVIAAILVFLYCLLQGGQHDQTSDCRTSSQAPHEFL